MDISPESLAKVLEKPSEERLGSEVLLVATWLKNRVKALRDVSLVNWPDMITSSSDILEILVQGCVTDPRVANELIIREGDIGDRMYVLLKGSAVIHQVGDMNENEMTMAPDKVGIPLAIKNDKPGPPRCIVQDSSHFGPCVGKLESGAIFGEVALIEDCRRTATVIACGPSRTTEEEEEEEEDNDDVDTLDAVGSFSREDSLTRKQPDSGSDPCVQMVVISRDLYNNTVKTAIEKQFTIRMNFVKSMPYFKNLTFRQKNQLVLSLDIHTLPYNTTIVRQKDKFDGIYFIIDGEAHIFWKPTERIQRSTVQHDRHSPGSRFQMILRGSNVENAHTLGTSCIGDLEMILQSQEYFFSARTTTQTTLLFMSVRNAERHFLGLHGKRNIPIPNSIYITLCAFCIEAIARLENRLNIFGLQKSHTWLQRINRIKEIKQNSEIHLNDFIQQQDKINPKEIRKQTKINDGILNSGPHIFVKTTRIKARRTMPGVDNQETFQNTQFCALDVSNTATFTTRNSSKSDKNYFRQAGVHIGYKSITKSRKHGHDILQEALTYEQNNMAVQNQKVKEFIQCLDKLN